MYTFNRVINDTKNLEIQRRVVKVEFRDGDVYNTKEMQFSINESDEGVKRRFKKYLDDLNVSITPIADLTVTDETPTEPTAAEIAQQEWQADRQKLATLMELVRDGVFTGNETQIANLQAKVKSGFEVDYLG